MTAGVRLSLVPSLQGVLCLDRRCEPITLNSRRIPRYETPKIERPVALRACSSLFTFAATFVCLLMKS